MFTYTNKNYVIVHISRPGLWLPKAVGKFYFVGPFYYKFLKNAFRIY